MLRRWSRGQQRADAAGQWSRIRHNGAPGWRCGARTGDEDSAALGTSRSRRRGKELMSGAGGEGSDMDRRQDSSSNRSRAGHGDAR